jgi:hypothetical protein
MTRSRSGSRTERGELLDQVRLIRRLTALERSRSRSGAELISHPTEQ